MAVIPFRAVGQAGARTALTLRTPITEDSQGRTLPIARVDGAIVIARGAGGDGAGGDGAGGGDGTGGGRLPDCNGDGRINTFDADCALQVSVGLRPASLAEASPATLLVLDADGNRQVTSGDARLIQQRVRDGVYRR